MSERYGKFELIKRLATGGMAQIYLARQTGIEGFEKLCVVKRILPHLAENDDFVKMFLHEAKIAARLNHPNVVQIYDLGQQDDSFFIAMEFIHGEDLRRVWKRAEQLGEELPIPFVLRAIADAAAGLDYAHKKADPEIGPLNIVHRDISPQNILVSFEGTVKVVDFGIAKAADADMNTRSGVLKGKYSYMSPEQAAGSRDIDHRTDLFALGVVLYELLTGTRLFKRSNDIQTLNAVIECKFAPPSEVNARIPKDLDPVVMKALTQSPDDRYANGRELQLALENWLVTHQLPSSNVHVAEKMRALYAERLAAEERSGLPVPDEGFEVKSAEEEISPRKRSSTNRSPRPHTPSSRERPNTPLPPPVPSSALPSYKHEEATASLKPPKSPSRAQPRASLTERSMPQAAGSTRMPPPRTVTQQGMTEISLTDADSAPARRKLTFALALAGFVAVAAGVVWAVRPTDPGLEERAVIHVDSEPRGATVIFDGKTVGGLTPVTLPPVAEGTYTLIVGKERYRDRTLSVTIPASGEHALPVVTLEPLGPEQAKAPEDAGAQARPQRVTLTIDSEPGRAAITVEGTSRGLAPAVVEVEPGAQLHVRAELAGYVTAERTIRAGEAATQREQLMLQRVRRENVVRQVSAKDPKENREVPDRHEDSRTEPPRAVGTVRFAITPVGTWADVSCGSYHFGATPFPDKQLPAGTYNCTFTNPELGTKRERVEVRPNDLSKVTVKFN